MIGSLRRKKPILEGQTFDQVDAKDFRDVSFSRRMTLLPVYFMAFMSVMAYIIDAIVFVLVAADLSILNSLYPAQLNQELNKLREIFTPMVTAIIVLVSISFSFVLLVLKCLKTSAAFKSNEIAAAYFNASVYRWHAFKNYNKYCLLVSIPSECSEIERMALRAYNGLKTVWGVVVVETIRHGLLIAYYISIVWSYYTHYRSYTNRHAALNSFWFVYCRIMTSPTPLRSRVFFVLAMVSSLIWVVRMFAVAFYVIIYCVVRFQITGPFPDFCFTAVNQSISRLILFSSRDMHKHEYYADESQQRNIPTDDRDSSHQAILPPMQNASIPLSAHQGYYVSEYQQQP